MASELGIMPVVKDKKAKCCICGGKKQLRHAVTENILCIDCNATNGLFGAWLDYESSGKFLIPTTFNTVVILLWSIFHSIAYVISPVNSVRAILHHCVAVVSMFGVYFCAKFVVKLYRERKEARNKMFLLRLAGPNTEALKFLDIEEEGKLVKQIEGLKQSVINKMMSRNINAKRNIFTAKGNMP